MAITTWDGYIGSAKQAVSLMKTASRTAVAANWFSIFDLAGNPGAGTLAGTSGEYKRHWVYARLLKTYPSVPKHQLGRIIEEAVGLSRN